MDSQIEPRILINRREIETAVCRLAAQINEDYIGRKPVLVAVLKGAFVFLADLARRLTVPHRVDFMALSSYGQTTTTTGAVRIIMDLRVDIESRHGLHIDLPQPLESNLSDCQLFAQANLKFVMSLLDRLVFD